MGKYYRKLLYVFSYIQGEWQSSICKVACSFLQQTNLVTLHRAAERFLIIV